MFNVKPPAPVAIRKKLPNLIKIPSERPLSFVVLVRPSSILLMHVLAYAAVHPGTVLIRVYDVPKSDQIYWKWVEIKCILEIGYAFTYASLFGFWKGYTGSDRKPSLLLYDHIVILKVPFWLREDRFRLQ